MGYWIYLQEAQVVIPRERQRLALAALKRLVGDFTWVINERYCNAETFAETLQGLRWRPVQDREGNVYTLEFNGQKIGNDRAPFEAQVCEHRRRGSSVLDLEFRWPARTTRGL
ncbi:MAG: hypothetical protein M3Z08_02215 [Chloroflexota bacterium]|nr:hypothetical protein [Chloroflexota bacterium]